MMLTLTAPRCDCDTAAGTSGFRAFLIRFVLDVHSLNHM
jgi:hypothetical protein